MGCPGWTLERAVAGAAEYGYDGIELRLIDDETITPELLTRHEGRIRRAFGEGGVELVALGSSLRFSARERAERLASEAEAARLIEIARRLDVRLIRVFGGKRPEGIGMDETIANVADSLARLAPVARDAGVVLVLETHDDFSRARDVAAVLRSISSPAVGALWDVHGPYEFGEGTDEIVSLLDGRIVHTHVKDARRAGDGWDLVPLGEGELPVRAMLRALAGLRYDGYVMVEWEKKWHPELAEPEAAFPQHARLLRDYLAETRGPAR